jgi:hypothetical protein
MILGYLVYIYLLRFPFIVIDTVLFADFFLFNFSHALQNCVRPGLIETLESLANTTATAIWSSTIALILKDKGEYKLHGLKRCAMP